MHRVGSQLVMREVWTKAAPNSGHHWHMALEALVLATQKSLDDVHYRIPSQSIVRG
jgi:hypothetical protein